MQKSIKQIKISINNKEYMVPNGRPLLKICQERDLPVASLCSHPDFKNSEAVCRVCMIKVTLPNENTERLLPSCVVKATPGMKVITEDFEIIKIRKTILELLFMEHAGLCHNCHRNLNCELQSLAIKYSIDQFRFVPKVAEMESEEALERLRDRLTRRVTDLNNTSVARDSAKCIECRRCIKTCSEIQNVNALSTQNRGIRMGVGTEFNTPLECIYCGQCALHCPTAAIIEKTEMASVMKALKDQNKILIAQVSSTVNVTLGEEFKLLPGSIVTGKMVAALKKCGFSYVFNQSLGTDLALMEEASELLDRVKEGDRSRPTPVLSGSCPASVLMVEQEFPELIPHLSGVRSPQMIMGSIIKTYFADKFKTNRKNIVVVSIVPCTANKHEAARKEFSHNGTRDIDFVITVRELGHIIKSLSIPFTELKPEKYDAAMGEETGPGALMGVAGGFTEALVRTVSYLAAKKNLPKLEIRELRKDGLIREFNIKIGNYTHRLAAINGNAETQKVLSLVVKKECDYDFIELMACQGGCISGGGQSYPIDNPIRIARKNSIYAIEKGLEIRESFMNPILKEMYKDFFYGAGSRKAEKLLHTNYYKFEYNLRKERISRK